MRGLFFAEAIKPLNYRGFIAHTPFLRIGGLFVANLFFRSGTQVQGYNKKLPFLGNPGKEKIPVN